MRLRMLALLFALGACGDDDGNSAFIGGACRDNEDCFEECHEGDEFPGGLCSVNCRDDNDCPGHTFCIERDGGICLERCSIDRDCRPGYDCKDQDREGAPGDAAVCIGD